jgi:peptidoglycan/LPS O-acetylase OafA/YrhL
MVFGGLVIGFGQSGFAPPTDTVLRFGLPAGLIVAAAVGLERAGARIGTRFAGTVGDASYSIYLSHYFFVGLVVAVAHRLALGVGPQYLLAAMSCVAAVFLGIGVYRFIERPLAGDFRAFRAVVGWAMGRIGRPALMGVKAGEPGVPKPGGPAIG